jgi:GNAT superfamily N-acetyltransferase
MTSSAGRDDGLSLWILEQDGMGVSMVATHRDGASVSVWAMGTPARFGRRGYGRALLAHVLHEARQDGARQGLLGATPAGFPLYDATGWHTFDEWQIFTNATSAQFSH